MNQLLNIATEHVTHFHETAWRMVEMPHTLATRKLVDSASEHLVLEELIESLKPKTFGKEFAGLHHLFSLPFRNPSLPHGSRFGTATDRSIWYGSLNLSTVLAEKAYYQFLFLQASNAQYGNVLRTFTAYSAQIKTERGLHLTTPPFSDDLYPISSPTDYKFSQALGAVLRKENIEAISYRSARDPLQGTNIALLAPKGFLHKKPVASSFQTWQSLTNDTTMEFTRTSATVNESKIFNIQQFYVEGKIPLPTNE